MADTITLRKVLNQGCIDTTPCHMIGINCFKTKAICCGYELGLKEKNFWVPMGRVPCFVCSHSTLLKIPIHSQDQMQIREWVE